MNENACNINNEIEYKNLESKAQKTQKKLSINRKISNGILKRKNIRSNTLREKNNSFKSSNSIKWDNKSINEQRIYRKNHPMDKERLKDSKSKFYNSAMYKDEDVYMKGLNKVNQLNNKDEIIDKVIMALSDKQSSMKRNNSCFSFGKFQRNVYMRDFYNITEKEKIFDDNLEEEQKLTLKNTLFNKIRKDVLENY